MTTITSTNNRHIDWEVQLDKALQKQEEQSSFNLENLGVINNTLFTLRNVYVSIGVIWSTTLVQHLVGNAERLKWLTETYNKLEGPVQATRLLSVFGLIYQIPKFSKAIAKAVYKEGEKRIDQIAKAIFSASQIGEGVYTIIKGLEGLHITAVNWLLVGVPWIDTAMKTVMAVANKLQLYSLVFSISGLMISARSWYKTNRYLENEFMKNSGYDEKNVDAEKPNIETCRANLDKCRAFFNVYNEDGTLNVKKANQLKRYFNVDGERLAARVETLFKEGIKTNKDAVNFGKMMKLLRERVNTTINHHKVNLIAFSGDLVFSALAVASILHPLGYVGLGIYGVALIGNFIYKKGSSWEFENKLGFIERPENDVMYQDETTYEMPSNVGLGRRMIDFMKWMVCLHTYKERKDSFSATTDHDGKPFLPETSVSEVASPSISVDIAE